MECATSINASLPHGAQLRLIDAFETLATSALRLQSHEQVILAGFDQRGGIKHWLVSEGSVGAVIVDQQHLLTILSDPACSAVALAHNHPSGNPRPSRADEIITHRIANFCQQSGQIFLEHIIVGRMENSRILHPLAAGENHPAIF